jgi:hypothetical protein
MTFSVTPLVSGGYLVEGQDSKGAEGTTVLHSDRWDYVLHQRNHVVAQEAFDLAVDEFFKPLTEAAEAHNKLIAGPTNEWGTVTIGEKIEGRNPVSVNLDEDGIILRILDETDGSSLRWVNGKLVAVL